MKSLYQFADLVRKMRAAQQEYSELLNTSEEQLTISKQSVKRFVTHKIQMLEAEVDKTLVELTDTIPVNQSVSDH